MMRILVTLVLLAAVAFCLFGFLATFEPPGYVGWRVGYAVAGLLCLSGMGWALSAKPRGA
jgi:hypothetical protein